MTMLPTCLLTLSMAMLLSGVTGIKIGKWGCTRFEEFQRMKTTQGQLDTITNYVKTIKKGLETCADKPNKGKDCADLYKNGVKQSGVYTIQPKDGLGNMEVYCDMVTNGGGWTVFQSRQDGSINFYRSWSDYKTGFGNLNGEFWLGNDNIHRLTHQAAYTLRVDLEDFSNKKVYAAYDAFSVGSEKVKYKLALGSYSGNAGDSLTRQSGKYFSTKDRDNDRHSTQNCALACKGGWWYGACHESNLNGLYHHGKHKSYADGVNWRYYKGYHYSMKRTSMKIRPVGFKSSK